MEVITLEKDNHQQYEIDVEKTSAGYWIANEDMDEHIWISDKNMDSLVAFVLKQQRPAVTEEKE